MKCPNCGAELAAETLTGVATEACPTCHGHWLTREELDALEDKAFDLGEKGSLVFHETASARACPECGKSMKTFEYRDYDLELEFCEEGHGFWLDAGEDERVLELMRQEEAGVQRSARAEDKWAGLLRRQRSGRWIDRLRGA
jgi:Zn-finger nucleic acid-binding protein